MFRAVMKIKSFKKCLWKMQNKNSLKAMGVYKWNYWYPKEDLRMILYMHGYSWNRIMLLPEMIHTVIL